MDAMLDFDRHAHGRLLFAEDFDLPPLQRDAPEPEVIEPSFTPAELAAAEAEAWQAGHEAALAEAASADLAVVRDAVAAVAAQFAAARSELLSLADQSAEAIARLLLHCLGTALPAMCAEHGEAELHAVLRVVLPGLFKEPIVTLRINPQHASAVAVEIERLDPDLATHVQIVPSEIIPAGDVRIGWRNGSAIRDASALWTQVTAALGLSGLSPSSTAFKEIEYAG